MGNYVFDADALVDAVTSDAMLDGSKHDMGGDIVPAFVRRADAGVYDYKDNVVPGSSERDQGYWRDVGTLGSYYAAHMDVVSPLPIFNLYNFAWPIFTSYGPQPPAKLVQGEGDQPASASDALLSPGVVVSGGRVHRSVLSPSVRVESGAQVTDSVLHARRQGRRRRGRPQRDHRQERRRPANTRIGVDEAEDKERGFVVEDGLTVLGKEQVVSG